MKRRRTKVIMCKKIKEISGKEPQEIYENFCNSSLVVDMPMVLQSMGIHVISTDFSALEDKLRLKGNDSILGMAVSSGDNLVILYSQVLTDCWINYVLAHELGHCCLHLPPTAEFHVEMKTKNDIFSPSVVSNVLLQFLSHGDEASKKEQEADNFAAKLLIPDNQLRAALSENEIPTIIQLAERFKVPEDLVRKKIGLTI